MNKDKIIRTFDKQAKIYEKRRRIRSERKWRERLLSSTRGNVLEVAVGAGANFHYYPQGLKVTGVDFSEEMLKKAQEAAIEEGIDAQFILSDVESFSFEDNSFDTVISTLSMCGYENPTKVLNSFNKWCKPDGKILLLEHGKSSNTMIGCIQTMLNPLYRKIVGCELNRDILHIIEHSDIHVERMEHYLTGTVHLVWAKPNKHIYIL
ncbi:class I SAM-dependent methyltransferase [Bacillus sp. DTU_2020_1000418_1_SI_GHA_SEK_038]|uniref:class I SAM-dependent methyltransferase n=1 Tax=Bacillus sp. DTU_2020_1000418_1_SI_GHA_SEK_038 TaxID=3077585 RepID=UPI0028EC8B31|nr:class I SAM-dependent methyltransferase [Bacillus sp. DTU_2020_1000418_1_SI_GHA_SEK_038]WNS76062.1 class I SAM-dependent methyltransferase [Bacillus sp. DTU_2020_1000418_1_SI_GHA_SEK_038]